MSIDYSKYRKFKDALDTYLPDRGEGDSKGSQIVTAVNKIIFKWYNDGDVYDNTGTLTGWANDISDYANWLYKYVPMTRSILDRIYSCYNDSDYEDLLWDLAQATLDTDFLAVAASAEVVGSVYECEGPFEFIWREDSDEDDWDEPEVDWDEWNEDDEVYSSTDIYGETVDISEEFSDMIRDLKDDFDLIITGLEKLNRSGSEGSKRGMELARQYSDVMQEVIRDISKALYND